MRPRPSARSGVISAAAIALLAVLATCAPARAAEKAIWGPTQLPDGQSAFPTYERLGVDTLQMTVDWSAVAPTRPGSARDPADAAYHWPAEVDAAAAEAGRHHITLALLVTGAPAWSNGGRSPIWRPDRPQDLADFLTAAARRYPAVRRWMIWGEPNKDNRFQPNAADSPVGPRAYAPLLDAAYGALKRASRLNRVIGGMTWTGGTVKPRDFVRWMRLPDGRPPRLDWYGHNPFPFRFPDLADHPDGGYRDISDLDTLGREVDRAYGRSSRHPIPLWLSEYTVQTDHGSSVFDTFVGAAAQARYLTAGYRIADDLGTRVAGLGWYELLDQPPAADGANWGLETFGLRHKPSYGAMARAPSLRARPRVSVASHVGRATVRSPGLRVSLLPRTSGPISVELRRHGVRLYEASLHGRVGRRRTLRLHRGDLHSGGLFSVVVRSARGATIRRALRVR